MLAFSYKGSPAFKQDRVFLLELRTLDEFVNFTLGVLHRFDLILVYCFLVDPFCE